MPGSTVIVAARLPASGRHYRNPTAVTGKLSKAGCVSLRGRERHGWRDRAYRDVLAASPADSHPPPAPMSTQEPQLLLQLLQLWQWQWQ